MVEDKEQTMNELKHAGHRLVCFKLADEEYAFDIADMKEVIRLEQITNLPQMPEFCLGVVNLRGQMLSIFDLRKKLGLNARVFNKQTRVIVTAVDSGAIGFVVDEILDHINLNESEIDPPPTVKSNIARECIKGLGRLEGRMITILQLDKIHQEIIADIDKSNA
ncbi:MAG: purine-binding chemotaxis protein CheW [Candidatus Omnitrophota bacterium]|jgi:purine-binding chemotaxis protein CheW